MFSKIIILLQTLRKTRAPLEAKFKLLYQIIQNIVARQILTTHVFHTFFSCILDDTLLCFYVCFSHGNHRCRRPVMG